MSVADIKAIVLANRESVDEIMGILVSAREKVDELRVRWADVVEGSESPKVEETLKGYTEALESFDELVGALQLVQQQTEEYSQSL
jgi:hypothetical protein